MTQPRIPEVGEFVRPHGTLVRIEEIPPKPVPPQTDYIFEQITARCEMRLTSGEVIKEIQTLNDFYGLETSVTTAIAEMKAYAAENSLGADSDVEVVVVRVVEQYRKRPRSDKNFYDTTFFDFESLTIWTRRSLPEPIETVAWSSKTGEAQRVENE